MPESLRDVKIKKLKPWREIDFAFTPPGSKHSERAYPRQNSVWHMLDF